MNSTTTFSGFEFDKRLVQGSINAMEEGTKYYARIVWSISTTFLVQHWLFVMGTFVLLLFLLILKALIGQWGSLYSLTYWTLYAVIIFIVGLIWGPEALVSDIFHVIYIIAIWPVCYFLTGWIWDRFGFRK